MNAPNKVMGPELANIPSNPIPSGRAGWFFKTKDNVKLRYALWPRLGNKNKGTICLVQGRTEYIEKYFETIYDFQQRGFAVATFDWRGQGGSDRLIANPKLGHVEDFNDYVADLVSFHADILLPDCPPPFYLVGHSMGGLASLFAATRDRLMFERVFLSAPDGFFGFGRQHFDGQKLCSTVEIFRRGTFADAAVEISSSKRQNFSRQRADLRSWSLYADGKNARSSSRFVDCGAHYRVDGRQLSRHGKGRCP